MNKETVEGGFEAFMARAHELAQTNYGDFIAHCNSYRESVPIGMAHMDPFSEVYANKVMEHYLQVTGLEGYVADQHELSNFEDVDAPLNRTFPTSSGDLPTIGRYMMGIGHTVFHLGVPMGGVVLEYGAGWGHMSFAIAQAGMHVTSIDIDPGFVELVNRRAARTGENVRAFQGRFGERPDGDHAVHAIVFYEAFHHAPDHVDVLRKVYQALLPGGRLLLVGEPFYEGYPIPWGLRLDGHSLWSVHNFKWMELGFSSDYIVTALIRLGFQVTIHNLPEAGPFGLVYVAEKPHGTIALHKGILPKPDSDSFAPRGSDGLLFAQTDSRMTIADMAGFKRLAVGLKNYLPTEISASITLGQKTDYVQIGPGSTVAVTMPVEPNAGPLRLSSEVRRPVDFGAGADARLIGVCVESISYEGPG